MLKIECQVTMMIWQLGIFIISKLNNMTPIVHALWISQIKIFTYSAVFGFKRKNA